VEGCGAERLCYEDSVRNMLPFICITANDSRWTIEESQSKLQLPPKVIVDGDGTQGFVHRIVKPSEILEVDASVSYAPDGSDLSFKWFQYKEVDSVMPIVCHLFKLPKHQKLTKVTAG
jgi:hypothetical protein